VNEVSGRMCEARGSGRCMEALYFYLSSIPHSSHLFPSPDSSPAPSDTSMIIRAAIQIGSEFFPACLSVRVVCACGVCVCVCV
jgi:hypothetical protein